jgi:hypothetical protein
MGLEQILGIDKRDLPKLNKKTATAVARTLIKYKYPNPKSNF